MEEGQQIIVLGVVDVYARDGKYQLYARKIVRDGVGLLYERFELLKKELQEMGMFAPEYKQKIPKYIRRLGVVTATDRGRQSETSSILRSGGILLCRSSCIRHWYRAKVLLRVL